MHIVKTVQLCPKVKSQISTLTIFGRQRRVYIIDVLKISDVKELKTQLNNLFNLTTVQLVFFQADEDLRLLKKHLGLELVGSAN